MEPVNFEEQAKKQLQKREITPSAGSWEKLEQRLGTQQEQKKFNFWWIGAVAAVAVVFFFLGTFFGGDPVTQQTPVVVETPSEAVQDELPKEIVSAQNEEMQLASEEVEPKQERIQKNKQKQQLPQENSDRRVAVVSEKIEETEKEPALEESSKMAFLEPKQTEEQTVEGQRKPSVVSDSEVEALLMLASAEIEADTAYAQRTVSSKELLNEVEHELEESFRDKVFEVIKDGLVKAKTAVANRNF